MEGMTQFRITYDGPALATHEMDARELAPALLAMADLLESSVKALHGDKVTAKINVKGSFKTGSFNIDFNTALDFLEMYSQARDFFSGKDVSAAANALGILAFLGISAHSTVKGVAQVLKWLKGRSVTNVTIDTEGKAKIWVDNNSMEVEEAVLTLLRDRDVREAFDRVLSPLDQDGIDVFAAGDGRSFSLIVEKSEREYFDAPQGQDVLLVEEERKMVFSIVSLAFKDSNKWRLSDGNSTISAKILDEEFLQSVNASEIAFTKGDVLVCNVVVRQWQTDSGARTEYEVKEVIDHKRSAKQIPLPGLDQVRRRGPGTGM